MKENKTIHVISTVTLVTLFAKLLGIVRESLQARTFGTQIAADLYTTANNNTIYLFTTAAYALCIAAVPILTPRLRRSRKEGYAAANNLITISVLLSAVVAAVWAGATFLPSLAGSLWEGGAEESLQLAGYMRIMILTLPVIVLTYLLVALFQSLEHFILQGSMSIPYNLALILFLALFAGRLGVGGYVAAAAGRFVTWAEEQFAAYPEITSRLENLSINWAELAKNLWDFLTTGVGSVVSSTISATMRVFSAVSTGFISFIFAIYLLLQKEKLGLQCRRALYALLPKRGADKVVEVCALSRRIFASFITGQCVEAVILGAMFFASMSLLGMPYALLVGCLIAVTALIPIVGAFIGCAVGAFLLLMISPMQALAFVVLFLVLQQIEGNLIYPHVVGNSVGLPSIWVLFAVTVGGKLMGIAGMLIFIPLTSVLYSLFRDWINQKASLKAKQKQPRKK